MNGERKKSFCIAAARGQLILRGSSPLLICVPGVASGFGSARVRFIVSFPAWLAPATFTFALYGGKRNLQSPTHSMRPFKWRRDEITRHRNLLDSQVFSRRDLLPEDAIK